MAKSLFSCLWDGVEEVIRKKMCPKECSLYFTIHMVENPVEKPFPIDRNEYSQNVGWWGEEGRNLSYTVFCPIH